jgi:signal transduction histidine kinase
LASCLIIDPDEGFRRQGLADLGAGGHLVGLARDGQEGLAALAGTPVDVVLVDAALTAPGGDLLVERLLGAEHDLGLVVLSAAGVDERQAWLRRGAGDCLARPCPGEELRLGVARCLERLKARRRCDLLARRLRDREALGLPPGQAATGPGSAPAALGGMHLLGQVAAGVAHEINNPLAFVGSGLDTLEQHVRVLRSLAGGWLRRAAAAGEGPAPEANERQRLHQAVEEVAALFEEMRAGLERIADVVATLRAFAEDADPAGRPTHLDLNQELGRVLTLLQGSGLRFQPIQVSQADLPGLHLPSLRVRQLLLELLGRFLRSAAELQVRTGTEPEAVWLEIEAQGGAAAEVALSPGGDERALGWLSLEACREAARALGGELLVKNTPLACGLRLRLPVPRAEAAEEVSP